MAGLEEAALSGELFRQHSATSGEGEGEGEGGHSHDGHEHEHAEHDESSGLVRGAARGGVRQGGAAPAPAPQMRSSRPYAEAAGGGARRGAQTGPKGVVADQRAAAAAAAASQRESQRSAQAALQRAAITAPTVPEEDASRRLAAELAEAQDDRARWREQRLAELRAGGGGERGLREVGRESFVHAVERRGWVVVLIYEPDIARCQEVLADTVALARALPRLDEPVMLVRARASQLAFSLLPAQPRQHSDNYDDDDEDEPRPDPDVLPTMLVYRDGELERNWVRVDFDLGPDGVEGLLRREGILRETKGDGWEQGEE